MKKLFVAVIAFFAVFLLIRTSASLVAENAEPVQATEISAPLVIE